MQTEQLITIVIPCRNEVAFISRCLASLIDNGYPSRSLDIVVVDGMSDDGTREILNEERRKYEFVRVLDNRKKTIPAALNIGIESALGDIVLRADAHSEFERGYIQSLVDVLMSTGADVVGGVWKVLPRHPGRVAEAIARTYGTRFAAGGNTYRSVGEDQGNPTPADTAAFGCFRKTIFSRVGGFDERLERSEDMEMMSRISKAGGRILLVPKAKIRYFIRSTYGSFFRHAILNGGWVTFPLAFAAVNTFRPRHYVPLLFVIYLVFLVAVLPEVRPFLAFLVGIPLFVYILMVAMAALRVALSAKDVLLMPFSAITYVLLHVGYGIGSLLGIARAASYRAREILSV